MVNNLEFIIFNLVFFSIGQFTTKRLIKSENLDGKYIFQTPIFIFYPLIGIIFLSFFIFLVNFIFPIEVIKDMVHFFGILMILYFLKINLNSNINFFHIFSFFIVPFILAFSTYNIKFNYDAEAYHLATQAWILHSKITFGLSKFFIWHGHSSLYDYLQTVLSFQGNFIYQHYLNLIFFSLLINFIGYHILFNRSKLFFNASIFILFFGILDNFGVGGGSNGFIEIQMVGKPDVAVGVVYLISSLFLIYNIYISPPTNLEFIFLLFFLTYLIQVRVISISLIFLFIPFLLKNYRTIKPMLFSKFFVFIIFYNVIWLIKNLINSACLFFPLQQSCLTLLSWNVNDILVGVNKSYSNWVYAYKFDSNFFTFLNEWLNAGNNWQQAPNLIISLFILAVVRLTVFKKEKNVYKYISIYILLILFVTLYFTFHIRYSFGLILLLVSLLSLNLNLRKFFSWFKNSRVIYILLIVISVGIPRGYSYNYFLNNLNYYELEIDYKELKFRENQTGYGIITLTNKCYDLYYCSSFQYNEKNTEINLENYFGTYNIFVQD